MDFLIEEFNDAKKELAIAEKIFNEADSDSIEYATMRLSLAEKRMSMVYKNIKNSYNSIIKEGKN